MKKRSLTVLRFASLLILVIIFKALPSADASSPRLSTHLSQTDTTKPALSPDKVQFLPQFPGGQKGWSMYMKTFRIPMEAIKNNATGNVKISFVVESDGSLSTFKILQDPGYGMGEEALRVMKASPRWMPGIQNGRPVRVAFVQPFNFTVVTAGSTMPVTPPDTSMPAMPAEKVQLPPAFPGGEVRWTMYLEKFNIPEQAIKNNAISGLKVSFVVEKDGSLSTFKIVQDPGYGMGEEALRLMKASPRWKPGIQNGRPVRVAFVQPFNFAAATR